MDAVPYVSISTETFVPRTNASFVSLLRFLLGLSSNRSCFSIAHRRAQSSQKTDDLIRSGHFDRIDDEQLNGSFCWLQAQTKFLNCREYGRSCWLGGSGRGLTRIGIQDGRRPT